MNTPPPEPAQEAPLNSQARPSLPALFAALFHEARTLFGAEIALASAELRLNAIRLAIALALMLAGGLMLGTAGVALLGALIAALAPHIGPVGAALVTALAALVAGGILVAAGAARLRNAPLAPRRAIANLKKTTDSGHLPQEPDA